MESAPLIGRRLPSSESSPRNRMFFKSFFSSAPVVPRMPSAMGRSNPEPSFFTSAGARFTVMFCKGNCQAAVLDGGLDALAAFAHGGIRQADGHEHALARGDVNLHLDGVGINAKDGGA